MLIVYILGYGSIGLVVVLTVNLWRVILRERKEYVE